MTIDESVLKRLYIAAAAPGGTIEPVLASDVLQFIGRLQNALRGDLRPMGFERLMLILGEACGALSMPHLHSMLVDSIKSKALNREYIASLRDQLTEILDESSSILTPSGAAPGRWTHEMVR